MTDTKTDLYGKPAAAEQTTYLNAHRGLLSWAFSSDHKRHAIMHGSIVAIGLAAAGAVGLIGRLSLVSAGTSPESSFGSNALNLEALLLVFCCFVPAIPVLLGNFVLPMQCGATKTVRPGLGLLGLYLHGLGATLLLFTLISPLLTQVCVELNGESHPFTLWMFSALPQGLDSSFPSLTGYGHSASLVYASLGMALCAVATLAASLNLSVTVRHSKGVGCKLSPFAVSIQVVTVLQLISVPALLASLALLCADRAGSTSLLVTQPSAFPGLFGIYLKGSLALMAIPALGVAAQIISANARRPLPGQTVFALSLLAYGVLATLGFGSALAGTSLNTQLVSALSLASLLSLAPALVCVVTLIVSLSQGVLRMTTPLAFAVAVVWVFALGAIMGLYLDTPAASRLYAATSVETAHFHLLGFGTACLGLIAGVYWWLPKIFGARAESKAGKLALVFVLIGMHLCVLIQAFGGVHGMPRLLTGWLGQPGNFSLSLADGSFNVWPLQIAHLVGLAIVGIGLLIIIIDIARVVKSAKGTVANPWGAADSEWQTLSPPPPENFTVPLVAVAAEPEAWSYDEQINGFIL